MKVRKFFGDNTLTMMAKLNERAYRQQRNKIWTKAVISYVKPNEVPLFYTWITNRFGMSERFLRPIVWGCEQY